MNIWESHWYPNTVVIRSFSAIFWSNTSDEALLSVQVPDKLSINSKPP
jgi:hypothetical protein